MDYSSDVTVTIKGHDDYSTIQYTKSIEGNHYEVPIIGLYPGIKNTVILEDDKGSLSKLMIETEVLPLDFQKYKLVTSTPSKMESGISLFTATFENSYTALLDCYGEIRGYISNQDMGHCTSMNILENGNMLGTGDEYRIVPYNMLTLWEYNWLGKIFKEYQVPNGVHHDLRELPNGDFMATSNNKDMFATGTREDLVIIIDRESGEVKKEYNFRNILDETQQMHHHYDPSIKNAPNKDWMHVNGALYYGPNNSIIVSSPTQSQVVSINADTEEINWILGTHENYEGSSEFMSEFLLTPIGNDFEWQWGQHHPMVLPDFDEDMSTIDLILFDNGQTKSALEETQVDPKDNFSRGVQFRINTKEMTVEQIWQYGKQRGTEGYATFLGDANYLYETVNRIITFGGQLRVDGVPVDDIVSGVTGDVNTVSRIVEVTEQKEVVFEILASSVGSDVTAETYQAKRIKLFQDGGYDYNLGEIVGSRVGERSSDPLSVQTEAPNLFLNKIAFEVEKINIANNRLLIDGVIKFPDHYPRFGKAMAVLRSKDNVFVYDLRSGLGGRIFGAIDLDNVPNGNYAISFAGVISDGDDILNSEITTGHIKSEYKVTIKN